MKLKRDYLNALLKMVRGEKKMQLNLMNLFDGYVRNYHTFNLTVNHGKHSFTMTEIEYFSRLGSMLGYHPFTEDTCNGIYRPMDLTWWGDYDSTDGYWNDFVLHLERENLFNKDVETLEKLFADREYVPGNVIGIMNVQNKDRIDHLIKLTKKMSSIENALLICRTNSTGKNQSYFDEVYAYLFNKNKLIETKKAYVSEISDTLFMHFEESIYKYI